MTTSSGAGTSNQSRRRSARLEKTINVQIAGRGPDGQPFVEQTSTLNISIHGAGVVAAHEFGSGAPLALRRAGARPVKARVVSCRKLKNGHFQLGIEFLDQQDYWDLPIPPDWEKEEAPPDAEAAEAPADGEGQEEQAVPAPLPPGVRAVSRATDDALEALLRKAEMVRAHADQTLRELEAGVEEARRKGASDASAQLNALSESRRLLAGQLVAQGQEAAALLQAQAEAAAASLARGAAASQQTVEASKAELQAAAQSAADYWAKLAAQHEQQANEIARKLAGQIERQGLELVALEAEETRRRERTAAFERELRDQAEQHMNALRGELRAAGSAVLREIREQFPALGAEASAFLAAAASEQKSAASEWLSQAIETFRTSVSEAENSARAALREQSRAVSEEMRAALEQKIAQARQAANTAAAAVEARVERLRTETQTIEQEGARVLEARRAEWASVAGEAETRLRDAGVAKAEELSQAGAAVIQQMTARHDELQAAALSAGRQLDHTAGELRELGADLDRKGRAKHDEMDVAFAALLERHDTRKQALDRLFESIEDARGTLRSELDALRRAAEEQRAALDSFGADQQTALLAKATGLEQKLNGAALALEASLQERASASLASLEQAFTTGLGGVAEQARSRFGSLLEEQVLKHLERAREMMATLQQEAAQLRESLQASAERHEQDLAQTRNEVREQVAAARAAVSAMLQAAEERLKQASEPALAVIEKRQAEAGAVLAEAVAAVQKARTELSRELTEVEKRVAERQRAAESQGIALATEFEQKQKALDVFYRKLDDQMTAVSRNAAAFEQRVEDARATLRTIERDTRTELEKRSAALAQDMRESVTQVARGLQQELLAEGEATQGVFEARLRTAADQVLASARKAIEQFSDACAADLDRTLQKARAEYRDKAAQFTQQCEEEIVDHRRRLEEFPVATLGNVNEQIQQMSRLAMERVREAHEMLLREIPSTIGEAEKTFREVLAKAIERSREDAVKTLETLGSQLTTEAELEMRRRLYAAAQAAASGGESN